MVFTKFESQTVFTSRSATEIQGDRAVRRALMLAGRLVPWHVLPHTGTAPESVEALAYRTYRQSAACPLELKLDPRAKPRSRLDGQKKVSDRTSSGIVLLHCLAQRRGRTEHPFQDGQ